MNEVYHSRTDLQCSRQASINAALGLGEMIDEDWSKTPTTRCPQMADAVEEGLLDTPPPVVGPQTESQYPKPKKNLHMFLSHVLYSKGLCRVSSSRRLSYVFNSLK